MARPFKLNDTPTAPFSLREVGPLKMTEVSKRLNGATYRTARGAKPDGRATVDPKPCPHCGSLVEWSTTGKRNAKGGFDRYVYARCRGHKQHRWSFQGAEAKPTPPQVSQIETALGKIPRPGTKAMDAWITERIAALNAELTKLQQFQTLSHELGIPSPQPSIH